MDTHIKHFHEKLRSELKLMQSYIEDISTVSDQYTNQFIQNTVKNNGKYLRPILLMLCAKYVFESEGKKNKEKEQFKNEIARFSAILELIQTSSLIHDDVLDSSDLRRNKPTLNNVKNNRFAILVGDYLIAQSLKSSYKLINQNLGIEKDIHSAFLDNILNLVLGEIQQNNFNENIYCDEDDSSSYLRIIENKTASLFSLAGFVGAKVGGGNVKTAEQFSAFGSKIGMAYQIIDDLRDLRISNDENDEEGFQDLIFGVKTLPYIFADKHNQGNNKLILNEILKKRYKITYDDKKEIIRIMVESKSIEASYQLIQTYLNEAKDILSSLTYNANNYELIYYLDYLDKVANKTVNQICGQKLQPEEYLNILLF